MAAALSSFDRTVLVGPPDSGRGSGIVTARGFLQGRVSVTRAEFGDHLQGDVSLIAVKAHHLAGMAREVAAATKGPCIVVCNGMGLEEQWGPSWKEGVEPAVLTAGFLLQEPGLVDTFSGAVTVQRDSRAREVFSEGSIPLLVTDDMEAVRWSKWLVNSIINPVGALTGLRNDELLPAGLGGLVDTLWDELVRIMPESVRSRALPSAEKMLARLLKGSSNECSMLQDMKAGRRTEIDFLTGLHSEKLPRDGAASLLVQLVRAKASPASV